MNAYRQVLRRRANAWIACATLVALGAVPASAERCGTWRVTGPSASAAASPAARPAGGAYQVGSAHILVHYADSLLTPMALDVRDAAELAWRVLVDTIGYNAPPPDGTAGGDARTDIYLLPPSEMAGAWGTTYPDSLVGAPYANSKTAYVTIVDTLSTPRRLTVSAHEFFHVVQIGYDASENTSFLEMLSTWAEKRVVPGADLYLDVLPNFFTQPWKGLFTFTYSNVPWAFFLTQRYGDGILREILEQCGSTPGPNVVAAHDAALGLHGSSTIGEYTVFAVWNYFTGARDDGQHYREGASWPELTVQRRVECLPFDSGSPLNSVGRLGAYYWFLDGNDATVPLRLRVQPDYYNATHSVFAVTRFQGGVASTEQLSIPGPYALQDSVDVADWPSCDSLLAVYEIDTSNKANNNGRLEAFFPNAPPPSQPYALVLDRDACRHPFDGVGDEFTTRDGEEAPFAQALASLGVRAVVSDSIPSDLTLCGGVFVVRGDDGAALTLSDAELDRLSQFMDTGGDVYLEGNDFGRWVSSPAAQTFWAHFGCSFVAGAPAATGNVSAWHTVASSPLGVRDFTYDYQGGSDDNVGELIPAGADTLAVDGGGHVRMTVMPGPLGSARVHSTVLLGGSTGVGTTRAQFLDAVIHMFDSLLPALAARTDVALGSDGVVTISGVLEGYESQALRLRRATAGQVAVDVHVGVVTVGGVARFQAQDRPAEGTVTYRLEADVGGEWQLLWQGSVDVARAPTPLALLSIYPTPSAAAGSPVTVVLSAPAAGAVDVRVYDVAGRAVLAERRPVSSGVNRFALAGTASMPSGVYFLRVSDGRVAVHRKFQILR